MANKGLIGVFSSKHFQISSTVTSRGDYYTFPYIKNSGIQKPSAWYALGLKIALKGPKRAKTAPILAELKT